MRPLYSVAEIRKLEQAAFAEVAPGSLMREAGRAASDVALSILGSGGLRRALILAGPGNNGGDALEVAANLADAGVAVLVAHFPGRAAPSAEAQAALARAQASTARFITLIDDQLPEADLIVDGLFGIGLARELAGEFKSLVRAVNARGGKVLALDTPSGLDADTGGVVGGQGVAIRATHTVTYIGDKPGLHTADGREHAGQVTLATLGLSTPDTRLHLLDPSAFAAYCQPRSHSGHKGSYGNVAILGGASGMCGAPVLAARTALLAGAGRVYVAAIDPALALDPVQPEVMYRSAEHVEFNQAVVVAGPGMGDGKAARHFLQRAIDAFSPLVLDADGLNLIAHDEGLRHALMHRHEQPVLTPHPLEAARLLGMTAAVVQQDRLSAASELAGRLNAVVVLKGSGTVIATPEGDMFINPTGNPGLATAGTGDVLAGLIGALLAQGWPRSAAALGAVWLHGAAADRLVAQGIGPIGLTAGELPAAIRAELNRLCA
ncbi:NAD(P)H-hydrate dehydratase [Massilia sp. TS11]|uniref:NAD(P)H-hydrate dehydratase n=1 Tax=Massilia sp. TS11 TaxID=2908003 RepID=UPI001EDBEA4B|nr:NAD(P)H-hydrate dehydratase [Massilia sp. TS11]MCG2584679.1 NAD(P)H-hydrate dehydratase [Massilia sp. TS11]